VLSSGVGNSVFRLGYCLRKLMLLVSNATPRYQTSAAFLRIIDESDNAFPFLMRFTVNHGVQEPLLGEAFRGVVIREIHKNTPAGVNIFRGGLFKVAIDNRFVCKLSI
jgi:hypothetical protein